ncbi:MerR family DNA-binding transcriptional regulator [Sinomicrobium weinanense]|nr:MerR family transcriptional regulator [Sinomicrobium weinanense]
MHTLRLHDKIGLLKPSVRTEKRYRLYGKEELLRLQQFFLRRI